MRDTAYEWCLDHIDQFLDRFNETLVTLDAQPDYHGMVDGLIWTDEFPARDELDEKSLYRIVCVLVHIRTSLILGETVSPLGIELITKVRDACPNWSFNNLERNSLMRKNDYENLRQKFFNKVDKACQASDKADENGGHVT